MASRFFHRLRRCRVLFALALCAWLALAGMAWGQQDCCAAMGHADAAAMAQGGPPMAMSHAAMAHGGALHGHHGHAHAGCTCAHLCTAVAPLAAARWTFALAAAEAWRPAPPMAPRAAEAPPLRPPLAA
jgi:hypothetical protein